ncbi:MAG: hypothetical protein ACWA41_02290 [Putridiphycobacter sp.]
MNPRYYFYIPFIFYVSIYGLIHYKKLDPTYKYLTILVFIGGIIETFNNLNPSLIFFGKSHYQILTFISLGLHFFIFHSFFKTSKFQKISFWISIILLCLAVISTIFFQKITKFPTNNLVFLSIQGVFLSILSFIQIINQKAIKNLYNLPEFWLSISVLFFYTINYTTLAFFFFYAEIAMHYYSINYLLFSVAFLYYIGLFIAILQNKKQYVLRS